MTLIFKLIYDDTDQTVVRAGVIVARDQRYQIRQ